MAIILNSERRTFKARFFISLIYLALSLGAITMIYPFAVMVASSFSSSYDYNRHSPVIIGLFDRGDRFMRSISMRFKTFPLDVYPSAPAHWTNWARVAEDRDGVTRFAEEQLDALDDAKILSRRKEDAARFLRSLSKRSVRELSCFYDPRDVARFVEKEYGDIDSLNAAWPVRHKSFFDVSFSAESKRTWRDDAEMRRADEKSKCYFRFMKRYIDDAIAEGDFVSRTMPRDLASHAPDIRNALAVQFVENGWRDFFESCLSNYRLVTDYIFLRGRAFANTILLVILSILASLTVNPLAAYALSRFRLKSTEKIILFLLATMAFPAAVTAIPGFLLIRDLGLLNTFAALVLPGVASGMSIFILKGFFDALPRELYEAAAIDGAGEWTVFLKITLPTTTPILAVNALNAFIHAYSSWEWAFLVCQKESHWTLAVWMYQMSQTFAHQPWCVMAGFVMVSIPTAAVFLACQKIILRGIVLPSMK